MTNTSDFTKGVGIGVVIGAAVGAAAAMPMGMKKKGCKTIAGRAMKAIGEVMAGVADSMGL